MDLHDFHVPVHPHPAVAVVARRSDHAADRRAVAAAVDVVRVVGRVPTVVVVHKSVEVVVHAVVRNFKCIHPVVVDEVHVVVIGPASFENTRHNPSTVCRRPTRGDVPRQVRIDVVVAALNVVPLLPQRRVVGHRFPFVHLVVELHRLQPLVFAQLTQHRPILGRGGASRQGEQMDVGPWGQHLHVVKAVFHAKLLRVLRRVEHRDEFPRNVGLRNGTT